MPQPEKTPFYEKHLEYKGKMVDFNGWNLPLQYEGIIAEVLQTRRQGGLFDISHMGEALVRGKDTPAFLQRILTNNIAVLRDHRVMYSPVCNPDGGTLDDILVYRYASDHYLLVLNAANTRRDCEWFQENLAGDVVLEDISSRTAQLALQGPESAAILKALTRAPLEKLKYYHFLPRVQVGGVECLVSRTGYTGEDGFELYCARDAAMQLWDVLWEEGRSRGLAPAGLGARDILRLEAGLPLYGHELSEKISPLEAGLDRFVSFAKEGGFIGREALIKKMKEGLTVKLAGIEMLERGIPREGYALKSGECEVGRVSSGTYSPTLDKNVAMVFLRPGEALEGSRVSVVIRGKEYKARVVKLPFYRREKQ